MKNYVENLKWNEDWIQVGKCQDEEMQLQYR